MLRVVKMLLKGEVGGCALNSHGNYIVGHGKSWNCVFEFRWEHCDWDININKQNKQCRTADTVSS